MEKDDPRIEMWAPPIREALATLDEENYEIIVEAMFELGGALVEALTIIEQIKEAMEKEAGEQAPEGQLILLPGGGK